MNKNKGFSLMELLLVMFIIGILVSNIIATFGSAPRIKAYQAQMDQNLGTLRTALAAYFQETGNDPISINDLVSSGILQEDPSTEKGVIYVLDDSGSVVGIRNVAPYMGGYVMVDRNGQRTTGGWEMVSAGAGTSSGSATGTGTGTGTATSGASLTAGAGMGTGTAGGAVLAGGPAVSAKGLVASELASIAKAASEYSNKFDKPPSGVDDLVNEGFLSKAPAIPGVQYSIDEKGNIWGKVLEGPFKDSFVLIRKNGKIYAEGWQEPLAGEKAELAGGEKPQGATKAVEKPAGTSGQIMKWLNIFAAGLIVYLITKLVMRHFNK